MKIKPANRINTVKEYYFSKKMKEIDLMKKKGASIINLGIGNPDLPPSDDIINTLTDSCNDENNHGYQSYIGRPELRTAFSNWYKKYFSVDLNPDKEILPLIGSKEGIMHISMAFLNPGDYVLVPNPGYPTYQSVSNLVEAKTITYNLTEENNWYPDFKEIESNDLSKVKIMWVNYPNMPTGTKSTFQLFEELIKFGKKHNILICNDNPYSFILNNEQISILNIEGAKEIALELNSLSKSGNMAGWRVGMVAGDESLISYILRVKSNVDTGMFMPIQIAASKSLEQNKDWYNYINDIYKKRRHIVFNILDLLNCKYDKNQVGMFVWAKIPDNIKSAEEMSDLILNKTHVFITPGIIFGSNGIKYIRISLCCNEEMLLESKKRIKEKL